MNEIQRRDAAVKDLRMIADGIEKGVFLLEGLEYSIGVDTREDDENGKITMSKYPNGYNTIIVSYYSEEQKRHW